MASPGDRKGHIMDDVIALDKIPAAPILSPSEAMKSFQLAEGFELEQIAAEPLVQDPVAMTWDDKGNAWVIEMTSYMNDIVGSNEEVPSSKIVKLSDTNGDGILDKRVEIMTDLVLPRSIAFYGKGIIFATHTSLFYADLNGDKIGKKELIDPAYATNGNVEHRDNGMLLNVDNWFYNAKSTKRYRFLPLDGLVSKGAIEIYRNSHLKVLREDMGYMRGQWGIARDDYGRLYFNTNSSPVYVDRYYGNPVFPSKKYVFNRTATYDKLADTKIYPIRMTPGINRGYMKNMLSSEFKLQKMTATCGPVVYRGNQFPKKYRGLVLAAEPAANLVKATVMTRKGDAAAGSFLLSDSEILASTDERFRPVHQVNAPDGTISIVDLYRGILQHRGYMTSYLERQIKSRDLDKGIHTGRIYRLKYKGSVSNKIMNLAKMSSSEWVTLLAHPNAWHREHAQRLLVQTQAKSEISSLKKLIRESDDQVAIISALWTLEGLVEFDAKLLKEQMSSNYSEVVIAALGVIRSALDSGKVISGALAMLKTVDSSNEALAIPLVRTLVSLNQAEAFGDILSVFNHHSKHKFIVPVTFSAFKDQDESFVSYLESTQEGKAMLSKLKPYLRKKPKKAAKLSGSEKKMFDHGKKLFLGEAACFGCHGQEGQGMPMMGPPLDGSEWVTGSAERLRSLMLHGLSGPITVKKKKYTTPMVMPGLKDHPTMKDYELASVATYIRNEWSNRSKPILSLIHI